MYDYKEFNVYINDQAKISEEIKFVDLIRPILVLLTVFFTQIINYAIMGMQYSKKSI